MHRVRKTEVKMTEKEEGIRGLVKSMPFHFPPQETLPLYGLTLQQMLEDYTMNAPIVFPIAKLSNPIDPTEKDVYRRLSIRAIEAVKTHVYTNRQLIGVDFVLIDGTAWADIPDKPKWGKDIISVVVTWKTGYGGYYAVVGVTVGTRRFMKGHARYHQEATHAKWNALFIFDIDSPIRTEQTVEEHLMKKNDHALFLEGGPLLLESVNKTKDIQVEYPVAAANYLEGEVWYVPRPCRHHHVIHSVEFQEARDKHGRDKKVIGGFLTNHGNFMTRYRAMYKALCVRAVAKYIDGQKVTLTTSTNREFATVERGMGGILLPEDLTGTGYRISNTPLFSEDLW